MLPGAGSRSRGQWVRERKRGGLGGRVGEGERVAPRRERVRVREKEKRERGIGLGFGDCLYTCDWFLPAGCILNQRFENY